MIPSVDAMCTLSLPDSFLDGIVQQPNTYSLTRAELEETILVDNVIERNSRWMHPNKYQDITQQDIPLFYICNY